MEIWNITKDLYSEEEKEEEEDLVSDFMNVFMNFIFFWLASCFSDTNYNGVIYSSRYAILMICAGGLHPSF